MVDVGLLWGGAGVKGRGEVNRREGWQGSDAGEGSAEEAEGMSNMEC